MRTIFKFVLFTEILFVCITINGQVPEWLNLVPLESTRENVEKILGKPEKYFETYGTYIRQDGTFSVWYTRGGCQKGVEGLQWNVQARKMASLLFYPKKSLPLKYYVSDISNFEKSDSLFRDGKKWYVSADGSIGYETIVPNGSAEFVYSISIEPAKNKDHLLCGNKK